MRSDTSRAHAHRLLEDVQISAPARLVLRLRWGEGWPLTETWPWRGRPSGNPDSPATPSRSCSPTNC